MEHFWEELFWVKLGQLNSRQSDKTTFKSSPDQLFQLLASDDPVSPDGEVIFQVFHLLQWMKSSLMAYKIYQISLKKMGHPRPLYRLFSSFQTLRFLQQINVKMSIQCSDSNPRPSKHLSPLITTRLGLSSSWHVTLVDQMSVHRSVDRRNVFSSNKIFSVKFSQWKNSLNLRGLLTNWKTK